jgi:hypothetical protein
MKKRIGTMKIPMRFLIESHRNCDFFEKRDTIFSSHVVILIKVYE